MLTNAPKGTKDIMMDQVYKWHYVEKKWKEICARYGFKEIRTPIFEHTELFQRGVGDTTDIVQKEIYLRRPRRPFHHTEAGGNFPCSSCVHRAQTVCGSAADQAVLRYSLLPL